MISGEAFASAIPADDSALAVDDDQQGVGGIEKRLDEVALAGEIEFDVSLASDIADGDCDDIAPAGHAASGHAQEEETFFLFARQGVGQFEGDGSARECEPFLRVELLGDMGREQVSSAAPNEFADCPAEPLGKHLIGIDDAFAWNVGNDTDGQGVEQDGEIRRRRSGGSLPSSKPTRAARTLSQRG